MRLHVPLILLTASLCPAYAGAQTEIVMDPASGLTHSWGTSRIERYDVAYRLDDPSLTGCGIVEISFPFDAEATSGHSIWMSRSLNLEDGSNIPDIMSEEASPSDGKLSITLPNPVAIPEDGCYIGFSFSVDELNDSSKEPVTVADAPAPGKMFVHTSRRYLKWGDQGLSLVPSVDMTVSGPFGKNAVALVSISEAGTLSGDPASATAVVRNHGTQPVSSLGYSITSPSGSSDGRLDFNPALPANYLTDVTLDIPLGTDLEAGDYPYTFTITDVNGSENEDSETELLGCLYIYPFLPQRTPLMEECTGTWCGWCPRGTIGMEKMMEMYPEEFVYVVYHRENDPMNTVADLAMPNQNAPSGTLDRVVFADPYNGTVTTGDVAHASEGIGAAWNDRRHAPTVGSVSVKAQWDSPAMERILVETSAEFVRKYDHADFRMVYMLTADGLSKESKQWAQSNYYSGLDQFIGTDLEELVGLPPKIENMVYDGVVVESSDNWGIPGSIPESFAMLEPISHSYEFHPDKAVNHVGQSLPIDKGRLTVVAAMVDAHTGEVVNCASCGVVGGASVESISGQTISVVVSESFISVSGADNVHVAELYSLDGIMIEKVEGPGNLILPRPESHGIYILKAGNGYRKLSL